jgi:DNA-binding transcriptional MerR regulator
MLRYFYSSDDLDELAQVETTLTEHGITTAQIHVLSEQDSAVDLHQLHQVQSVLKKDVVHTTEIGALIGVMAAALILMLAYILGWTESAAGWVPFVFLAIVILGFCTWEGGFIGIQQPNSQFVRFQKILQEGKHIFFIDIEQTQEEVLTKVLSVHPRLISLGTGDATPRWVIRGQDRFKAFMKAMP